MIITCKQQIPRRWIAFTILPWASFAFNSAVVGAAFIFSLKKFVENPAGLTFILSLPGFLAIFVAPLASFLSDRVWTRYGRRKPFVVVASIGMIAALAVMPLVPNLWALIAAYILFHVSEGLSAPRDPLKQEIVPPHERGRATGAMTWCQNLATVVFYAVMLGRFDDVHFFAGFPLHGETVIYWSAALMLTLMLLLIALGIKEIDQKSPLLGQRLSIRNIVGGLLDRELWPVYLLVVANGFLNFFAGFGPFLSTLLYTDQWGYTKQEMGANVAIGGIINVFIIGLLTFFADRLPRMRAFQSFICLSLVWYAVYYCYVYFVLPDHRPSLLEIIFFGEVLSILSILIGLVYIPLIYDYVRRNKMGTFAAGLQIANRGVNLITLNGVGLFVWGYAALFLPAAGETTHVVLRESVDRTTLTAALQSGSWDRVGETGATPAEAITAQSWQADGVRPEHGRAWEIRLHNPSSEALAEEKKTLERERSPLLAEAKRRRDDALVATNRGRSEDAERAAADAAAREAEIALLTPRIDSLNAELAARAETVRRQVVARLADQLMPEGEQLVAASAGTALIVELATDDRPDPRALERTLDRLREEMPELIDLRPLRLETGYGIAASVQWDAAGDEAGKVEPMIARVRTVASQRAPRLFAEARSPLAVRREPTLRLEFDVIEQPVVTYVSPINRVFDLGLKLFNAQRSPTYRLSAIARKLRVADETNHVRVTLGQTDRSIAVTAVLQPDSAQADAVNDPLSERIAAHLGVDARPDFLRQARFFSDRIEQAAAAQRVTVARPVLGASYAPLQYDYMSGYLWVFFVGVIGLVLTIVFSRMEAKGAIRKRGVEEAAAS